MRKIAKEGLIPKCGCNSKRVQDHLVAIHITPSFEDLIEFWACALYKTRNLKGLKVLRFNLKNRAYEEISKSTFRGYDYALLESISPKDIEYLSEFDKHMIYDKKKQLWRPITDYKLYY